MKTFHPKRADKGNEFTRSSPLNDVISHPVFGDFGRMLFPVNKHYYSGNTLGSFRLAYYGADPDKNVEIVNYLKTQAERGESIFYDIYSEAEKAAEPAKRDTGLFFFRGKQGERFAICNAGGAFAFVGAMHDSFPHALELAKHNFNAFALIYRPGWKTAFEDLAQAISFIFSHADELQVNTDCYSLWGGSAGARMAAMLGTYGPAHFGGDDLPRPGTVVMQYTGHDHYSRSDPPTFACVGTNDWIADWRVMKARTDVLDALGIPTEFHAYKGLGHGFGLGTGTDAEGWIDDAIRFWERQTKIR